MQIFLSDFDFWWWISYSFLSQLLLIILNLFIFTAHIQQQHLIYCHFFLITCLSITRWLDLRLNEIILIVIILLV